VKEVRLVENIKDVVLEAITKLPDSASIDDIMYRLYVIDKVNKGREAVKKGEMLSAEELLKETDSW
jgi:hypothetical protein